MADLFQGIRVKVAATSSGLSDFGLGSAVSGAFQDFSDAGVTDGAEVDYVAFTGSQFEAGTGIYTASGPTLSRASIDASSNGGAKENFSANPIVGITLLPKRVNTRKCIQEDTTVYMAMFWLNVTAGTSYTSGTYTEVPLTGGSGSGAEATILVSGGGVQVCMITDMGTGYQVGDVLSASAGNVGGTGSGFQATIVGIGDDENDGLTTATPKLHLQAVFDTIETWDFNNQIVTVLIYYGNYSAFFDEEPTGSSELGSSYLPGDRDALLIYGVGQTTSRKQFVIVPEISIGTITPNRTTFRWLTVAGFIHCWESNRIECRDLGFVPAPLDSPYFGGWWGDGRSGINLHDSGCSLICFNDWTIEGEFQIEVNAGDCYIQWGVNSVTAVGTVNLPLGFLYGPPFVYVTRQTTFTGTFTGKRFTLTDDGFFQLGSRTGGLEFLPGDTPGTVEDVAAYSYENGAAVLRAPYMGVAFTNLPSSPVAGMIHHVTDSNTTTWGATVAGGGSNKVLAWYNGTNWTVAGV